MINKDEIIFAVDENNNPIEPVERKIAHAKGIWHRTTDIAVVNSSHEVLCHQRSMLKDTGPGLWDACFGGHMPPGIEPAEGAVLELNEEAGLDVGKNDLTFVAINKMARAGGTNNEFRYFYIYKWDGKIEDLNFEKEEIEEVKWVTAEVLKNNRNNTHEWAPMPYLDQLLKNLWH